MLSVGMELKWYELQKLASVKYKCGFCTNIVASDRGYAVIKNENVEIGIRICPHCSMATFFHPLSEKQHPGSLLGEDVDGIDKEEVQALYDEARRCASVNAYTCAVMACRKLLMNIAVSKGAKAGDTFASYVDYLCNGGYVPVDARQWIEAIKDRGNDANHEIKPMTEKDARLLIHFVETLLRVIYETPKKLKDDLADAGPPT